METGRQFEGNLDEVAFYSKILSPARIEAHFSEARTELNLARPPENVSVLAGQTATWTVMATGRNRSYQWFRNGEAIRDATGPEYSLVNAQAADNGARFVVRISNGTDHILSEEVVLTVISAAEIVRPPADARVVESLTATFQVEAIGPDLKYQWFKNGGLIPGATGAVYTTPPATLADEGALFTVRVSNDAGSATSEAARLSVTALPADAYGRSVLQDQPLIYYRFDEPDGTVARNFGSLGSAADGMYAESGITFGQSSAFSELGTSVMLDGMSGSIGVPGFHPTPMPQFTVELWLNRTYDWPGLTALLANTGWESGFLHLNLVSSDSGTQVEFAINGNPAPFPRHSPGWKLDEWNYLAITYNAETQPGRLRIFLNGALRFEQAIAGAVPMRFTGGQIGMWSDSRQLEGLVDEFAFYDIALAPAAIESRYSTVQAGVDIVVDPADIAVLEGRTARFQVVATGPDLQYQWLRNGGEILGASGSEYAFTAQADHQGDRFAVRVGPGANAVTSAEAVLSVVTVPSTDYATTVLGASPLVFYRFEETSPASVAKNLGTLGPAADGLFSAPGLILGGGSASPDLGNAAEFNEGYVEMPDLGLGPLQEVSIEFWLNPLASPPANGFFALWANHGWEPNLLHFNIWGGPAAGGELMEFAVNGNPAPTPRWTPGQAATWSHWVATYDSGTETAALRVYLNGDLVLASPDVGTPILFAGGRLGMWGDERPFRGLMDEFAIYPAVLSHEQVLRNFAAARVPEAPGDVALQFSRVSASQLELSWTGPGFVLQSTTALSQPDSWTAFPEGGASPVTVDLQEGQRYFRLHRNE